MAKGLCHVLRCFLRLQEWHRIFVSIEHVPGFENSEADALSRGSVPALLGFMAEDHFSILWNDILSTAALRTAPSSEVFSALLSAAA